MAQPQEPEFIWYVNTQITIDASGHVSPFTIQEALDQAKSEIDALNIGTFEVRGFAVQTHWDGPVVSTFGQ